MCPRELDGKQVEFGTSGYTMDDVFVLYDRGSDSIWYPIDDQTFQAVGGDKQGESLAILDEPAPMALGDWLDREPDTLVLLPPKRER